MNAVKQKDRHTYTHTHTHAPLQPNVIQWKDNTPHTHNTHKHTYNTHTLTHMHPYNLMSYNGKITHNTHNTQNTQHTTHNTHTTQNTQHTHTTHTTHTGTQTLPLLDGLMEGSEHRVDVPCNALLHPEVIHVALQELEYLLSHSTALLAVYSLFKPQQHLIQVLYKEEDV